MNDGAVSVIIVSRHRPAALLRCIVGLSQQDHTDFEMIVVADSKAAARVRDLNAPIKVIAFDTPNISAARNAGLAQAAGAIVAFIDDDAVPEPTWLTRLTSPFQSATLCAATGFVLGRNGISYQWKACEVDTDAQDHDLAIHETTLRQGSPRRAVKTQGTNSAFRRDALCQIGGFDAAYRFYLDDADVALRLAALGQTAVVPGALVHHGFEASERRTQNRVPLSLFDIAASTAVFLRRHNAAPDFPAAYRALETREAARASRHRSAGRLTAATETALLQTLKDGWQHGLSCDLPVLIPLATGGSAFQRYSSLGPVSGRVIAGRIWQKSKLLAEAQRNLGKSITTVICLSPTARYHRVAFQPEGFWLQTGGVFGKSDRSGAWFQVVGFRARIEAETIRIKANRPIR